MSVEHAIKDYIAADIMRGHDGAALQLDDPLIGKKGVLDSSDIQRLVAFVETQFEVEVPDEYLVAENFASIRAIARMVTALRRGS